MIYCKSFKFYSFCEEHAMKCFLFETTTLGIVFQQGIEFLFGNCHGVVLYNCSGDVVTVTQTVVGKHAQPFCLIHIPNHRAA